MGLTVRLRIVEARENREITTYRLAKDAGLHVSGLQRIEKNQCSNPRISTMARIAMALGCRVDDLYEVEVVSDGG